MKKTSEELIKEISEQMKVFNETSARFSSRRSYEYFELIKTLIGNLRELQNTNMDDIADWEQEHCADNDAESEADYE